jgi:hypothetical protein
LIKALERHIDPKPVPIWLRVLPGVIAGATIFAIIVGILFYGRHNFVAVVKNTGPMAYFRFESRSGLSEVGDATYSFTNSVVSSTPGAPIGISNNHCTVLNGSDAKISTSQKGGVVEAGSIMIWSNLFALPSKEGHSFYLAGESEFRNDFDLQFETDDTLRFYTDAGTSLKYRPDPEKLVNQWHMVVATLDKGFQTLYWDGEPVQSEAGGGGRSKTRELSIGGSTYWEGRFFHGSLDEVALWNRALSASEVAAIYASTKPR